MTKNKFEQWKRFYSNMERLGFTTNEADALRRIEMTLHRWSEEECNGTIQRDGDDGEGAPRRYYQGQYDSNIKGGIIADRERGALKRLAAIMATRKHLWFYNQGDPRGCALYIGKYLDLPSGTNLSKPESVIDQYYSSRGVAVCL